MARITLVLGWIVLTLTSSLLIFKTNLHSDSLFLDNVMVDIFKYGGKWSDWTITPAPAYLPDMLTYALSYFIIPSPALRIVFVCVVQALLLAFACIHLASTVRPSFSINSKIFILVILSFFSLVAANSSMWLFFNSTNNHFGALIFPIFCMSMAYSYWDSRKIYNAVLIVLGVAAGTSSTPVFILSFTIPFLIFSLAAICFLRSQKELRKFLLQVITLILIGHFLASIINSFAISFDTFSGRVPITIDGALRSIGSFVEASRITFGRQNYFTFALAIFSVIAIVSVIFDFLKKLSFSVDSSEGLLSKFSVEIPSDSLKYYAALLFFLIAFPASVIGSIASGGFIDSAGYRYFSFPIALGVLLWIVRLDEKLTSLKSSATYLGLFLLLAVTILGIISTNSLFVSSGRESVLKLFSSGIRNSNDDIGECIQKEAEDGFVFHAGVADFWNSRGVMYKTRNVPYILPVTNDLNPFFHIMTLGPLLYPEKYGAEPYNFLIVRKSGTETQFDLTPEVIGHLVPPPSKIVDCKNTDSTLWLYEDLRLDEVIRKKVSHLLFQLGRQQKFLILASELPGLVGSSESTSKVARAINDNAGYLSYGPYVKIPKGNYKVTISYEATEYGNKWDAGRFNDPNKIITVASGDVPKGRGSLEFEFGAKKPIDQFEIRVWFGGRGSLVLNSIALEPRRP